MSVALLALAMTFSEPASSQLSVATGNWAEIPLVEKRGVQNFAFYDMQRVDAALTGECRKRDRRNQPIDVDVPFLIEFAPDLSVKRVVVQRLDCPSAEQIIGSAVLHLAKTGEFRPTSENQTGWYRGQFSMTSR